MTKTRQADYPAFIAFRASVETAEALKTKAEREGRSMSDVLRDVVRQSCGTSSSARPANHSLVT